MRNIFIALAVLSLTGCSLVQWLPSSACTYVKYERKNNLATVEAVCPV